MLDECIAAVMTGVAIALSLVIVLIVDLDRPGDGWIVVPEDATVDVRNGLGDSKPPVTHLVIPSEARNLLLRSIAKLSEAGSSSLFSPE
jgi:hypothetical protein